MEMFEQASRMRFRYSSPQGNLTTEQLWELPLTARSGASLDVVAKGVNSELKAVTEESFVAVTTNPAKPALEAKLEIVKHIIAVRMAENEATRVAAAKKAEKSKIMDIIARKQDGALEELSVEELTARASAL